MKENEGNKRKVKIRGGKELAEDLNESNSVKRPYTPNPIKKQIRLIKVITFRVYTTNLNLKLI